MNHQSQAQAPRAALPALQWLKLPGRLRARAVHPAHPPRWFPWRRDLLWPAGTVQARVGVGERPSRWH